ncbi:MAG: TraV family lipoprotein [Candidatus Aenigmatarchaeota archaeon]
MKRLLFLTSVFAFACSPAVSEWDKVYRYEAPAGWSKEKYERQVAPQAFLKPPEKKDMEVTSYEKERLEMLQKLLQTPPTPLRVPDTVIRVLILPWVDSEGNLNTSRYVFFRVEEGKWILGDYLLKRGEPIRELKPLDR